jgi:hypothetical protein
MAPWAIRNSQKCYESYTICQCRASTPCRISIGTPTVHGNGTASTLLSTHTVHGTNEGSVVRADEGTAVRADEGTVVRADDASVVRTEDSTFPHSSRSRWTFPPHGATVGHLASRYTGTVAPWPANEGLSRGPRDQGALVRKNLGECKEEPFTNSSLIDQTRPSNNPRNHREICSIRHPINPGQASPASLTPNMKCLLRRPAKKLGIGRRRAPEQSCVAASTKNTS